MAIVLLSLGSNLGDLQQNLLHATREIAQLPGTRLLSRSSWHSTLAIGGPPGQGDFLNGALLLETCLEPLEVSDAIHEIEDRQGRQRQVRWEARLIDIDLLLYDQVEISEPQLILPHPRLSFRRFVLEPASEIAGFLPYPGTGWTLSQLLAHLSLSPRLVMVAAENSDHRESLAAGICQAMGCPRVEKFLEGKSRTDPRDSTPLQFSVGAGENCPSEHWLAIPELLLRCPPVTTPTLAPALSGDWSASALPTIFHRLL